MAEKELLGLHNNLEEEGDFNRWYEETQMSDAYEYVHRRPPYDVRMFAEKLMVRLIPLLKTDLAKLVYAFVMLTKEALEACQDELEKIALTRYEKEIAAGNIPRGAVTPGVANMPGLFNMASRKASRDQLYAGAEKSPEQVAGTRLLNEKKYQQTMKLPAGELPQAVGIRGILSKRPTPKMITGMTPDVGLSGDVASNIHVPEETGALLRQMNGGFLGKARVSLAQGLSVNPAADIGTILGPKAPVDSSLNHAALQHELGEASVLQKGVARFHASHLGVEPILRENIALQGDPEAQKLMASTRQQHGDDAHVQKLLRRAGATPDAPLAVGGRQQRTIERMLDQSKDVLSPASRKNTMLGAAPLAMRQELADLPLDDAAKGKLLLSQPNPFMHTPHLPAHVPSQADMNVVKLRGEDIRNEYLKALTGAKDLESGGIPSLKNLINHMKDMRSTRGLMQKFLTKGH